jgi:membrane associated rhomboid family serine protease
MTKSDFMQVRRMPPIPEVVKNLLILNVLMYLASMLFPVIYDYFSLYPIVNKDFQPYQIVTHMFMHSHQGIFHILFNMFALWMFGRDVEYAMGAKKFLIFYFVAGLGAVVLHQLAGYIEFQYAIDGLSPAAVNALLSDNPDSAIEIIRQTGNGTVDQLRYAYAVASTPAVGASGAIYGVLAAFGLLYPNRMIMLLIPPIPMKAKYFVLVMGAFALYAGFSGAQGGVAHFAHLGGAIFGYLMILYWRRKGETF